MAHDTLFSCWFWHNSFWRLPLEMVLKRYVTFTMGSLCEGKSHSFVISWTDYPIRYPTSSTEYCPKIARYRTTSSKSKRKYIRPENVLVIPHPWSRLERLANPWCKTSDRHSESMLDRKGLFPRKLFASLELVLLKKISTINVIWSISSKT